MITLLINLVLDLVFVFVFIFLISYSVFGIQIEVRLNQIQWGGGGTVKLNPQIF